MADSGKTGGAELAAAVADAETPEWAREIEFIEVRGGCVHVVAHDGVPVTGDDDSPPDVIGFLMGATYTRCARRIVKNNGGLEHSAWGTTRFADERLCQKCVGSVAPSERWRLFDHPQPDDPEDDQ